MRTLVPVCVCTCEWFFPSLLLLRILHFDADTFSSSIQVCCVAARPPLELAALCSHLFLYFALEERKESHIYAIMHTSTQRWLLLPTRIVLFLACIMSILLMAVGNEEVVQQEGELCRYY